MVLQPSHFQHGLGPVILEMLDQLTGDGGAEDMHVSAQSTSTVNVDIRLFKHVMWCTVRMIMCSVR